MLSDTGLNEQRLRWDAWHRLPWYWYLSKYLSTYLLAHIISTVNIRDALNQKSDTDTIKNKIRPKFRHSTMKSVSTESKISVNIFIGTISTAHIRDALNPKVNKTRH